MPTVHSASLRLILLAWAGTNPGVLAPGGRGAELIFVGHSLGGALASLAAADVGMAMLPLPRARNPLGRSGSRSWLPQEVDLWFEQLATVLSETLLSPREDRSPTELDVSRHPCSRCLGTHHFHDSAETVRLNSEIGVPWPDRSRRAQYS